MNKGLKESIINLRKSGKTYNEISDILSCSKGNISFHCRKENLDNPNLLRTPTIEEIKELNDLYTQGFSIKEISLQLNYCKTTLCKYLTVEKRKIQPISKSKLVVSWRQRIKRKLIEYKGGKCEECGYNKCINALEFHHLDRSEKDFTISGKSWKYETLKIEVDKCKLLCSNCHKEIHYIEK